MIFWALFLLAILVIAFISIIDKNTYQDKKRLTEIKDSWGKPDRRDRNYKLIAAYLNLETDKKLLSPQSAADIDIAQVFAYADRTVSKPGEQYLYKKMHLADTDVAGLAQLELNIAAFTEDEEKRDQIRLKLSKLNSTDAYYLPELFAKPHQSLFPWLVEFYIKISAIVVIALIVMLIARPNQVFLLMVIAMLIGNALIHYKNKSKILKYTHSLPQLLILFDTGKWLFNNVDADTAVKESLSALARLKRSLGFINLQNAVARDPTDLVYLFMEWLNMFLLIEPMIFIYSISNVNRYLKDIQQVYEFVARIDMAIGIKCLRVSLPYYCLPDFSKTGDQFALTNLYHPLVDGCVANSIVSNTAQGVLVTGSNMSGKTTFIRAVTINALMAQTLHTCCAKTYQAPLLNIFTSIQISDDINAQKSYFQAEALSVLDIVKQCGINQPVKSLVIIDEIFRGTNTIERVAAAKAVLSYLISNKNFVFVSTHDLELAKLLGNEYAVYSFEELQENERLIFDYKIKTGLLRNRNGIAVLQGLGYPQAIIDDAYAVSRQLSDIYTL